MHVYFAYSAMCLLLLPQHAVASRCDVDSAASHACTEPNGNHTIPTDLNQELAVQHRDLMSIPLQERIICLWLLSSTLEATTGCSMCQGVHMWHCHCPVQMSVSS